MKSESSSGLRAFVIIARLRECVFLRSLPSSFVLPLPASAPFSVLVLVLLVLVLLLALLAIL